MSNLIQNFKSALQVLERRFWLAAWLLVAGFGSLLTVLQRHPTIVDSDAFYHAKMAVWLSQGVIIKNFIWLPWTVLAENFADHHFLYHILLIPFVQFTDPLIGMKVSIVVMAVAAIVAFFFTLRSLGAIGAFWWTIAVFTTYPLVFRINAVKAVPLGLIVYCWGLLVLFKRKPIWLFLVQFIFVLTYSAWPLLLVTTLIHAAFIFKDKKSIALQLLLASISGSVLGLILHPNFPQILIFDWYQIVQFALIPPTIGTGTEWLPNEALTLVVNHLWIIVLTALIGGYVLVTNNVAPVFANARIKTLGVLAVGLFIMTAFMRRYSEVFTPIAGLELALLVQRIYVIEKDRLRGLLSPQKILIFFVALPLLVLWCGQITYNVWRADRYLKNFSSIHHLKRAATWIQNNVPVGTVVENASWSDFPELLFFNDQHKYVWGLDSRFLTSVRPDLVKPFLVGLLGQDVESYISFLEARKTETYILVTPKYSKVVKGLSAVASIRYHDEEAIIFYYDGR